METLYPRHARPHLEEFLATFPATLIHGPRQCGKTTLAQSVGKSAGYAYISLDAINDLDYAKNDPVGFVNALPDKVILDEIQKAPGLFSQIKLAIDENRVAGRFILTGSVSIMHVRGLSDSLAGRMGVIRMHPLAQTELVRANPHFTDTLFSSKFKSNWQSDSPEKLQEKIISGGYPAALNFSSKAQRINWYNAYITMIATTDAFTISRIRSVEDLPKLLKISATQTANLLNVNNLASSLQLTRPTVDNYITLLERLFLLERLPAWHNNRMKRVIKSPKLHLTDTGLACALLDVDAQQLKKDRQLLGQLLETFVLQELKRQDDGQHQFFHYRNKDGVEVDIVIERGRDSVAGVEVKASETIGNSDFRGLRQLQSDMGKSFCGGVVIYTGSNTRKFGDKLYAVPLKCLWEKN